MLGRGGLIRARRRSSVDFCARRICHRLRGGCPRFKVARRRVRGMSRLTPVRSVNGVQMPVRVLGGGKGLAVSRVRIIGRRPVANTRVALEFPGNVAARGLGGCDCRVYQRRRREFSNSKCPSNLGKSRVPLYTRIINLISTCSTLIDRQPCGQGLGRTRTMEVVMGTRYKTFSVGLLRYFFTTTVRGR